MSPTWFVSIHGQNLGPFSAEEVKRRVGTGEISHSTLVWREGQPYWTPFALSELGQGPVTQALQNSQEDPYGSFLLRVGAYIVDSIVLWLPSSLINSVALHAYGPRAGMMIAWVMSIALGVTYFGVLQAQLEGSPGKKLFGLALVRADNYAKLTLGQAFGRYAMMVVSAVVFCLGFVWVAFQSRKQGWHDLACGTVVVRKSALARLRGRTESREFSLSRAA